MQTSWRDRFWRHVDFLSSEECWLWTGAKDKDGYGMLGTYDDPTRPYLSMAHRLAYELMVGPIPDGLTIDHLCRNKPCVNPEHLEAVTRAENTFRGLAPSTFNKAKTHCPRGHELAGDNLYTSPRKNRKGETLPDGHYRRCIRCLHDYMTFYNRTGHSPYSRTPKRETEVPE